MNIDDAAIREASVIPLEFWTDHEQLPNGDMVQVDFVTWQKIGNPNHCGQDKVTRIKRHQPEVWAALKRYYEHWKKNEEVEVDGTRIENWPAVTRKMAELLKNNGFLSVEEFSKASDSDLQRLGMGALALRDKAKAYVTIKGGDNKAAGLIASMQERLKLLEEQNAELIAANQKEDGEQPKRRGRPPKGE